MGFSGGSLSSGSEWSPPPPPPPSDHLIRGERAGVSSQMAEGDFHSLSLKQPMVAR